MSDIRHASLFRNGRNQAIRIPREFELEGTRVTIRKEGNSLVIESLPSGKSLLDLLAGWDALDESLPEISDPPPAEEIF